MDCFKSQEICRAIASKIAETPYGILLASGWESITYNCKKPVLGGWGRIDSFPAENQNDLQGLDAFIQKNRGRWIFAHFNYEFGLLLDSRHETKVPEGNLFPLFSLVVPEFVAGSQNDGLFYTDQKSGENLNPEILINAYNVRETQTYTLAPPLPGINLNNTYRQDYLSKAEKILEHLQNGDIYEMNLCVPFAARGSLTNPAETWLSMLKIQDSPYSALYRNDDAWLLCCSPERFIRREGRQIISQPIKGTIRRGIDPEEDEHLKQALLNSEKERSENVMIVDLVRNDLGRIAETGTVTVSELFGLHTFPGVHQMISTIEARVREGISFTETMRALFPMGSMTGAPKIRATEIIAANENFSRGLFSGSVGYIDPEGDYDFNVVIRSILYDGKNEHISFPAGSAITARCNPEAEFEECILKAQSMLRVLHQNQ